LVRHTLVEELGLPLPAFHLRPDASLPPAAFAFRIGAVRGLPRIGLPPERLLAGDTVENLSVLGINAVPMLNPATSRPAALVARGDQAAIKAAAITVWDGGEFLILQLAAALVRRGHVLLTPDTAARLVSQLDEAYPLLDRLISTHLSVDRLAGLLRDLVREGVSIRNLRRILELVLRHELLAPPDSDLLASVRAGLADVITAKVSLATGSVNAYLVDAAIEDAVTNGAAASDAEDIIAAVRAEVDELPRAVALPAIVTRDAARAPLRTLLEPEFPEMSVLAYRELVPEANIQPIARIKAW
jgi:type III secretory pathway component EscV